MIELTTASPLTWSREDGSVFVESPYPSWAAREPVWAGVREAQDRDTQRFLANPKLRRSRRLATLSEQVWCMARYGQPVTEVLVSLEDVNVKYQGWVSTFHWWAK